MITAKQRKAVYERDGGRCVHCGIAESLTIQHRQGRGMGGSKSAERFSNWVTLCWAQNVRIEQDAAAAAEARAKGWKVSRNGIATPDEVPVIDWTGQAWLLDNTGGRTPTTLQIGA